MSDEEVAIAFKKKKKSGNTRKRQRDEPEANEDAAADEEDALHDSVTAVRELQKLRAKRAAAPAPKKAEPKDLKGGVPNALVIPKKDGVTSLGSTFGGSKREAAKAVVQDAEAKKRQEFIAQQMKAPGGAAGAGAGEAAKGLEKKKGAVDPKDSVMLLNTDVLTHTVSRLRSDGDIGPAGMEEVEVPVASRLKAARDAEAAKRQAATAAASKRFEKPALQRTHKYFADSDHKGKSNKKGPTDRIYSTTNTYTSGDESDP